MEELRINIRNWAEAPSVISTLWSKKGSSHYEVIGSLFTPSQLSFKTENVKYI